MNHRKFRDPLNGEIRLIHHDQNGKWVGCLSILGGQHGDCIPTGVKMESSLRATSNMRNTVSPTRSLDHRVSEPQGTQNVRRVEDAGGSECLLVMSKIMPNGFIERWLTSGWSQR
jgi:hypothetical protein